VCGYHGLSSTEEDYAMAATQVFPMQNDFHQRDKGAEVGICTCCALNWAKKSLKLGRGLKTYSEIGLTDHTMNAQMAVLRRKDATPDDQCELVGLKMVGNEQAVASIDDVIRIVKATPPHVAIFWTQDHTMGYRYKHHEKEFFDNEVGLYRAKLTADIKSKMNDIISGYGPVEGIRVVGLA